MEPLPARSRWLARHRSEATAVVEAGGLFDASVPFETERASLVLESLAAMGYDVVHLSAGDLALAARGELPVLLAGLPFTWVATNVRARHAGEPWPARTSASITVGETELTVLGIVDPDSVAAALRRTAAASGADHASTGTGAPSTRFEATDPAAAVARELQALPPGATTHVVVLSDLSPASNRELLARFERIDAVISTHPLAAVRVAEEAEPAISTGAAPAPAVGEEAPPPRLAPPTPGGRTMGRITWNETGGALHIDRLPIAGDDDEDPLIRRRLIEFYDAVAARQPVAPIDPELPPELAAATRYVGAQACAQCHRDLALRWQASAHAAATTVLAEVGRQYLPRCLRCHATGIGHRTGYHPNGLRPQLGGVQCESCHGPGSAHTRLPGASTIRAAVSDAVCQACHTEERSPGFSRRLAALRGRPGSDVASPVHGPAPQFEDRLAAAVRASGRAEIDLFVMSLCPYGAGAERELARLREVLGDRLLLRVHYIVRRVDAPPPAGAAKRAGTRPPLGSASGEVCEDDGAAPSPDYLGFTSLHGAEEVREDLRQLAVARHQPARWLDYLVARAADLEGDWRRAAAAVGLDPDTIEAQAESERAALAEDAALVERLGIAASPTLLVGGERVGEGVDAVVLARRICAALASAAPPACATLPACARDAECRAPGREGRCEDPGTASARCVYRAAPPVTLHVFNDPTCGLCNPAVVVAGAMEELPGLRIEAHDVRLAAEQELAARFGIDAAPGFVFEGIGQSVAFAELRSILIERGGAYVLDAAAAGRGPLYFRRPPVPRAVDLFVHGTGPLTQQMLAALPAVVPGWRDGTMVQVHHLLDLAPPDSTQGMRLIQRGDKAYLVPESAIPRLSSRLGAADVEESRRQACIAARYGDRLLDYLDDRAQAWADRTSASAAGGEEDWRTRVARLGMDPAQIGMCAGSGAADARLIADRQLADSLGIRAPAVLVANHIRFDGIGPWNRGAFRRALDDAGPQPN